MTLRRTRPAGIALALMLGLTLTACSDDPPTAETPVDPGSASADPTDEADAATGDAAGEDDDGADGGAGTDDGGGSDAGSEALGDRTTTALAAVATAEAEVEGAAYAIGDDDEGSSWEVDVALGDETVVASVDGTGGQVLGTETDDLDDDDRAALDAASVGLPEAIQRVVGESGGTLEDAELETDGGVAHWKVSVLTSAGDEEEYLVDLIDGAVTPGG
ncbi:hypothetical protein UQW22_04145 [Isoptericola halotolerans]|uniref:PepSY domain-containing protein n=1 Tax=Isoptericola halotolerans TaxID=300560 RepID=UPI00388FDCA5